MLKKLSKMRLAVAVACFIGLVGCSGGSISGTSTNGNVTAITIDNAGVVPVFGNSSTSTVVYVHNNSNTSISGISYAFTQNSAKANNSTTSKILSLFKITNLSLGLSNEQCVTIQAGQSCPLQVVTPILSGANTQGSMIIQASYKIANKRITFDQVINYAQVQNNQQSMGAKFQTGVNISGYGNSTGYATVYLYGSGQNQIYNVSSITIDKPAVTIVNGNISGHQIQSNFVQAVEISSPIVSSSISAKITVNSETSIASVNNSNKLLNSVGSQFSNSADILVEPTTVGAVLVTGIVPLINTNNSTNGSMIIQNTGDQNAVIGGISATSGISGLSGCSGNTLAPAASCTINFSVTGSGGSGSITIPYSGGSSNNVIGDVTWFNGAGAALVYMSASNNPVSFIATVGGSTTITVTNIGGYTLNDISTLDPVILGGSATATISNNNCNNQTLAAGASCSYDVSISDNVTDLNQQISLGLNASYTTPIGIQSYSQLMILDYNATTTGAIITISPTSASLNISGNTIESNTQILVISNNGNMPTNISTVLNSNQAFLTESATNCGASLSENESCTSTIQFGPTFSKSESSGTATYVVNYDASGEQPAGNVSSTISWTVQGYDQSISLVQQVAAGSSGGDGESEGTPYEFNISQRGSDNKSITLTYQNMGNHSLKLTGMQDLNFGLVWTMNSNSSTCIPGTTILAPNQTCDIVYTDAVESNILLASSVGGVFTENLVLPRLIYQDVTNGVQFNWTPNLANGNVFISVQFNLATVSNSVVLNESGTAAESVTVSHLLANVDDASNVTVISQMEDYFDTISRVDSSGCMSNSANGIMTQTCVMNKDNLSSSTVYQVNQAYLNESQDLQLDILFSLGQLSPITGMTSLSANLNLGKSSPVVAPIQ